MIFKMESVLKFRRAEEKDTHQIYEISKSLKINYQQPQKNGFLVYLLEAEDYKIRINNTDFFYVVVLKEKVHGFLMCYDNKELNYLAKKEYLLHESEIINYVLNQKSPFIFGDQIGISHDNSRQGIGKLLMDKLFEDMKLRDIKRMFVAILHKPIRNTASLKFCNSLGFEQLTEVTNKDGLVWGVCKLEN